MRYVDGIVAAYFLGFICLKAQLVFEHALTIHRYVWALFPRCK